MPTTPYLYSYLEAMIIYIDNVTSIVRGIAVCLAPEVVPPRLQRSDGNMEQGLNSRTWTSEHS